MQPAYPAEPTDSRCYGMASAKSQGVFGVYQPMPACAGGTGGFSRNFLGTECVPGFLEKHARSTGIRRQKVRTTSLGKILRYVGAGLSKNCLGVGSRG
jgi:hypothetical protein